MTARSTTLCTADPGKCVSIEKNLNFYFFYWSVMVVEPATVTVLYLVIDKATQATQGMVPAEK